MLTVLRFDPTAELLGGQRVGHRRETGRDPGRTTAPEGPRTTAVATAIPPAFQSGFDRDPEVTTPPLVLASGDNIEWCRGAAVLAIQAFVRGAGPQLR